MRHQPVGRAFRFDLFRGLAERQRLGLREDVGDQHVVMGAQRIERPGEGDEIARYEARTLMDQLVERMLAVGSRFAPKDRPGVVIDPRAFERDVLAVTLHGELLEIGGKPLQILFVGQYSDRLGAEEIIVPDADETHQHRQIAREWRGAKMLVHLMEAAEHCPKIVRADGQHGRQADRRIHGIAAADPVPEAEHVGGVDAEFRNLRCVGRDGDEMLGDGACFALHAGQQPFARAARVGHGFQRGEGLGGDDEQCLGRIEILHRFDEIRAVDVGYETECHGSIAVVLERFVCHDRPEIGPANADIDHIADALAGLAFPLAQAHAVGKVRHPVQNGVNVGNHVAAVVNDDGAARRAQRDMQDGAVFRDVDFVAAEHGVDAIVQRRLVGELQQQLQRLIGDPVFRIVEIDSRGVDSQSLAASTIVR